MIILPLQKKVYHLFILKPFTLSKSVLLVFSTVKLYFIVGVKVYVTFITIDKYLP